MPGPVAAAAVGAGISAVGGILGGLLGGRSKRPPNPPDYDWLKAAGPTIWNMLSDRGIQMMKNPRGLPTDIKSAMFSGMQDSISAGYQSAMDESSRQSALSGLSNAGGEADRRRYYAGNQAGEAQARAVSSINLADYQARLDEETRGQNLLFSLTNKSPVYSQIVAQNYWNQLQAANEMAGAVGGTVGNVWEYYQNQRYLDQNPYGGGSYGGYGGYGPTIQQAQPYWNYSNNNGLAQPTPNWYSSGYGYRP